MDSSDNIDSRSRNDVLAARQEKRTAQLAAKMKSKNRKKSNSSENNNQLVLSKEKLSCERQAENSQTESNEEKNVRDRTSSETKESKSSAVVSTAPEEKSFQEKASPLKSVEVDIAIKQSEPHVEEAKKKTEKTREEIKAEREARKQAKMNAKLKGKSNQEAKKSEDSTDEKVLKPPELQESDNKSETRLVVKSQSEVAVTPEKSKAELRAERRAKQEAQRAAKEAEKRSKLDQKENKVPQTEKKIEIVTEHKQYKEKVTVTPTKVGHQRVKLFSHLKFEQKTSEAKLIQNVHSEVIQLGIKYSSRVVMGSNARCVALLKVLKGVIMDYITPSKKEFSRGLESQLTSVMAYLNKCRPSSVSMINALRHIKSHLTQLPNDITDVEARRKLCDVIDIYIKEQIDVAGEAICNAVQKKIANGDNILIYACSSLLYRILVESHKSGKQFTVVVVDSGPWFEGREMLRRLVDHGIKCSYVLVSALSFIMREVTKVLLGAHALLANGSVMSRAGSALVALVANSYNVPVLVCCETYKFCERVQMDAFVYNELGNDEDMEYSRTENMKENEQSVAPLSVLYDITPADLVTAVVTELAILPCTSVPVILRIKPSDVVS